MQKSMSPEYAPSSEPLHISAKRLFLMYVLPKAMMKVMYTDRKNMSSKSTPMQTANSTEKPELADAGPIFSRAIGLIGSILFFFFFLTIKPRAE